MFVRQMNTVTQDTPNSPSSEQLGGGKRIPSPPPVQTPTRLRSKVKATERDTGLVHKASTRRSRLIDEAVAAPITDDDELPMTNGLWRGMDTPPEDLVPDRCASMLFTGVPSQSPFLTCKPKAIGASRYHQRHRKRYTHWSWADPPPVQTTTTASTTSDAQKPHAPSAQPRVSSPGPRSPRREL